MQKYKHIPLEGLVNVRDLGGFPAENGMITKYGVFVRSEVPKALTDNDISYLRDYGIDAVVDLRGEKESDNPKNCLRENPDFTYKLMPFFDPDVARASGAEEKGPPKAEDGRDPFDIEWHPVYISLLEDGKSWIKRVIDFFAEWDGGILFHCFTGKDRTGIIAAIVLSLCGVSKYDVMGDYSLSMVMLRPFYAALPGDPYFKDKDGRADYNRGFYRTAPETIERTLEHLVDKYGSVRNYVLDCGVSEANIEKLRAKLLEPAE